MKKLVLIFLSCLSYMVNAQDSILNDVQTFSPSKLLKRGQFDVQLFNNIYTQTAFRNDEGEKIALNQRGTYFGGLLQMVMGVSKNARINVGIDINIKSVRLDANPNSSPFKVLLFEQSSFTRTAISSIGPKIKVSPFKKLPDFSFQSAFWFPLAKNSESTPWLDYERYTSWTQFFYSHTVGTKFQLFYEIDILARIRKKSGQNSELNTPATFIFSYFPTRKATLYGLLQYSPGYGYQNNKVEIASYYAQAGVGFKYQLTQRLSLELLSTNFFASKNNGAVTTYNLGIRYLHL